MTSPVLPPLSVHDLITVPSGGTTQGALADAKRLVDAADRLGYKRYWVAEHHNFDFVTSNTPSVILANLGAGTTQIRLGSGGVMLPNHTPFVVAEQFSLLNAMFPGRIDLGLGRAPGTDPITAAAVRGEMTNRSVEQFPEHVLEILGHLGDLRPEHEEEYFRRLKPIPQKDAINSDELRPEVWMLGSSLYGAELAGKLGLPYSFANHFSMGANPVSPVDHYRRHFQPSARWPKPYVLMSASAIVADTMEEARHLAMPSRVAQYQIRARKVGPVLSPDEAEDFAKRTVDQDLFGRIRGTQHLGPAEKVARELAELAEKTGADELLLAATTHDVQTRIDTLEALAPYLPNESH